jgi:hypothetical protein
LVLFGHICLWELNGALSRVDSYRSSIKDTSLKNWTLPSRTLCSPLDLSPWGLLFSNTAKEWFSDSIACSEVPHKNSSATEVSLCSESPNQYWLLPSHKAFPLLTGVSLPQARAGLMWLCWSLLSLRNLSQVPCHILQYQPWPVTVTT